MQGVFSLWQYFAEQGAGLFWCRAKLRHLVLKWLRMATLDFFLLTIINNVFSSKVTVFNFFWYISLLQYILLLLELIKKVATLRKPGWNDLKLPSWGLFYFIFFLDPEPRSRTRLVQQVTWAEARQLFRKHTKHCIYLLFSKSMSRDYLGRLESSVRDHVESTVLRKHNPGQDTLAVMCPPCVIWATHIAVMCVCACVRPRVCVCVCFMPFGDDVYRPVPPQACAPLCVWLILSSVRQWCHLFNVRETLLVRWFFSSIYMSLLS